MLVVVPLFQDSVLDAPEAEPREVVGLCLGCDCVQELRIVCLVADLVGLQ